MGRYEAMFERLQAAGEIAFIPFVMLGDPDLETSLRVIDALVAGGADALELGIPFSDPIADGPTIQLAAERAIASGVRPSDCWGLLSRIRKRAPEIPIGLLVYANLVDRQGIGGFYESAAAAGVDSVLVADVPTLEAGPFREAAQVHGVQPVFIAPPNANAERLARVSELGAGYTYVVTRSGVTGANEDVTLHNTALIRQLIELGAPPPVLGFGISKPEHVALAKKGGAAGAISGSAVVRHIEQRGEDTAALLEALSGFVKSMKAAT